ncbi:MAG: hypothetical protein WB681_05325 [Candidatus Cybelea sp.]
MAEGPFLTRAGEWLKDIPEWALTVIWRWSTLIGGGAVGIPVYLWDRAHDPAHQFSLMLLYWIIGGALIVSGYDAWHTERSALHIERARNDEVTTGSTKADLRVRIEHLTIDNQTGPGSAILASVIVANHGPRATIYQWLMFFQSGDGSRKEAVTQTIQGDDQYIVEMANGRGRLTWSADEDLCHATRQSIAPGETRGRGFLYAKTPDSETLNAEQIKTIRIQCQTNLGNFESSAVPSDKIYAGVIQLRRGL